MDKDLNKILFKTYKKLEKHRIQNSDMPKSKKKLYLKGLNVDCALKTIFVIALINS